MTNHRLRGAMLNAEVSATALASAAEVDVKSVARWVSEDRVPYPATRVKIARLLNQRETFLWPSLVGHPGVADQNAAEVERVWARRSAVPSETWHSLFSHASKQLDVLVYAGGFLIESLDLADLLRWKASVGTSVRVLIGDPGSEAVKLRSSEISINWLPDRCATTATYLSSVGREPGVGIRCHGTTLYASTFRFDDVLLVNTHAYGVWASESPAVQLLQSSEAGLFDFYTSAFERVWDSADQGR